ncbi:FAD-dependent oxidoreductase [Kribbella turkmenica]|uniref:FAD-dependent oxidoreductase n=1 Tax=Kribbella turkmenica TaxID=2530375 RepID=A0A4R4XFW5_9ACTN|nr:FAD-dependent oxidoreductase [Kribbella turkmenica]
MTDVDVLVVGGGPAGLMLAGELRLAGVRVAVLERAPRPRETAKANGLAGQILELLRGPAGRRDADPAGRRRRLGR